MFREGYGSLWLSFQARARRPTQPPSACHILQATYILITRNGILHAGTPEAPHTAGITINLVGTRQTPFFNIRSDFSLGSKVGVPAVDVLQCHLERFALWMAAS